DWGATVDGARTVAAARALLRASADARERYDMVIVDLTMLGADPLRSVRNLRREFPESIGGVVALAQARHKPSADMASRGGIDAILEQPVRPTGLLRVLGSVLNPHLPPQVR